MRIVDDHKLQARIGFNPHAPQQNILDNMERFTSICAGRRFGKTELCAYLALREICSREKKVWVVSPTYDLSKKITNYVIQWISRAFPTTFKIQTAPNLVIESPTGSILEGKSAENKEGLMGEELDLCIMDEASAMSSVVWQTYLFPTLAMRKGRMVSISTPKGQNWFYDIYMKGIKGSTSYTPGYTAFHYQSNDNPYFPTSEWEEAKNNLPADIFDQEYKAVFLSDAASVFRNIEDCIFGEFEEPKDGHMYLMGVDLGKLHDFTAIVVLDMTTNHVVHVDHFNLIGWPLQKQRIIEIARQYNNALVSIDSTGAGNPITEDLAAEGLSVNDFTYTNKSKDQLITKLSIFIEQKRIRYPAFEKLINELRVFGYKMTKTGKFQYSAPEGHHDDLVNALALAVWEASDTPVSMQKTEPMIFPETDY